MPAQARRHTTLVGGAAAAALIAVAIAVALLTTAPRANGASLSQLQSELGASNAKATTLANGISTLNGQISQLDSQVSLVESRAAAVNTELSRAEAALKRDRAAIKHERKVTKRLKRRLARAQKTLAAELVSRYEQPQQSLVSLVINASGFQQMLDRLQFMKRANDAEARIIQVTRQAKAKAQAATTKLTALQHADQQTAARRLTQARALDGMRSLLDSRRSALAHVQAARTAALHAVRSQGSQLQSAITVAKQQLAAAQQATQQVNNGGGSSSGGSSSGSGAGGSSGSGSGGGSGSGSGGGSPVSGGSGAGAYNGWAIPYAIVLCESGGQNLPPNGAGASGYYQIIPSTWKQYGGTTAQAYQASKSEQGAVASKIWDGGKGASNWSCSAIVGIT